MAILDIMRSKLRLNFPATAGIPQMLKRARFVEKTRILFRVAAKIRLSLRRQPPTGEIS
jgi:hypothetical protein